jgi:hypothetical protein
MKGRLGKCIASICVVVCALVTVVSVHPTVERVRTEDRNGDHRPDVWLRYDDRGERAEVDIDTNFDGRPDVQEYYEHGTLVRREVDRNFNGRTDVVEEFDADTRTHTRSVVDVDDDGTADLLVLFRGDQPVFSKYLPSSKLSVTQVGVTPAPGSPAVPPRHRRDKLVPLEDPFRAETSLTRSRRLQAACGCAGLPSSGGLPPSPLDHFGSIVGTRFIALGSQSEPLPYLFISSPRAPPLS